MAMPNVKRAAFAYALQPDAVPAVRENMHLFHGSFEISLKRIKWGTRVFSLHVLPHVALNAFVGLSNSLNFTLSKILI